MKERPILFNSEMVRAILDGRKTQTRRLCKTVNAWIDDVCPLGKPGDILYVRETFAMSCQNRLVYKADLKEIESKLTVAKWTPSIHMPRLASRIDLLIKDVRIERLQDISEEDARAEGVERIGGSTNIKPWKNYRMGKPNEMKSHCSCASRSFNTLWESIYKNWDANPWVWVVEFEKIKE